MPSHYYFWKLGLICAFISFSCCLNLKIWRGTFFIINSFFSNQSSEVTNVAINNSEPKVIKGKYQRPIGNLPLCACLHLSIIKAICCAHSEENKMKKFSIIISNILNRIIDQLNWKNEEEKNSIHLSQFFKETSITFSHTQNRAHHIHEVYGGLHLAELSSIIASA